MKQFIITRSANGRICDTLEHLNMYGLNPMVVECENVNIPHINVLLTVQRIIMENIKEDNILILEDDVRLYRPFNPDQLVKQNEFDFSIICTGSFSVGQLRKSANKQLPYCTFFYGSQGVIYNKSIYKFFLNIKEDYIDSVSRFLPNVCITLPFLTYQKDYNERNKDNQLIKREHKFEQENERLLKLINHIN
ncbi:hypothetical protein ASU31_13505 [Pedobacter ginsenosidimutans]|uniref:Uncharacterized protein n=1 Tax=Pedobacter ginsenosidimutans TaxID=687842 RepID=A0A0T5VP77_9SPHI|nr:hypothetical protein [Pedobacter ginsenosidimutans]KRT15676.1 hypothetical protein ASU31_13505 [Pedobacter ginsenosidimutans]